MTTKLTEAEVQDRRRDHAETLHKIQESVKAIQETTLTKEGKQYVELAMQREARKEKFQRAIIEKTLASIIWSAVVGVGYLIWSGLVNYLHIK